MSPYSRDHHLWPFPQHNTTQHNFFHTNVTRKQLPPPQSPPPADHSGTTLYRIRRLYRSAERESFNFTNTRYTDPITDPRPPLHSPSCPHSSDVLGFLTSLLVVILDPLFTHNPNYTPSVIQTLQQHTKLPLSMYKTPRTDLLSSHRSSLDPPDPSLHSLPSVHFVFVSVTLIKSRDQATSQSIKPRHR